MTDKTLFVWRIVYALRADAAVIVHSGTAGGTWSGALENLKNGWLPLWVKPTDDRISGNVQLVGKGARWLLWQEGKLDIRQLFERAPEPGSPPRTASLFDTAASAAKSAVREGQYEFEQRVDAGLALPVDLADAEGLKPAKADLEAAAAVVESEANNVDMEGWEAGRIMTLYEFFLQRIQVLTSNEAKSADQLLKELDVSKTQLNAWLKRAAEEGKLRKTRAPVRYKWLSSERNPKQSAIF